MKQSLAPGIRREKKVTITPDMGVSHLGNKGGLLSTPHMIGLMEYTSAESVTPHLDEHEQTVGTMVHVWHRSAVKTGEVVHCHSEVMEVERRRILFQVKVLYGDTVVGEGTHERYVIDMRKFNA